MSSARDLPPINFTAFNDALLNRIESLVPMWLPGGVVKNNEYFVHSVFRQEKTASLSVRMRGEHIGCWRDHGGDEKGGDLLSLYAAINGLAQGKAAVQLARELGLEDVAGVRHARAGSSSEPPKPRPLPEPVPSKPPRQSEGWKSVAPVPEHAPAPTFKHQYRTPDQIDHTAEYSIDGALYGYVVRFRKSDGGKDPIPYTWCTSARDGASRWSWRQWDEPRPLYFPGGYSPKFDTSHTRTVVLVEGEKKADILQQLLNDTAPDTYIVASWSSGCKAWKKADWTWLAGSTVLLWPDCDGKREPLTAKERDECVDDAARDIAAAMKPVLPAEKQVGMVAMLGIGTLLRDSHGCTVTLLPIPEPLTVDDGWDCADAIQTDGWDGARVLEFFGRAQPLPQIESPKSPAEPIADIKRDVPVGTEDGYLDPDGFTRIGSRDIPNWLVPYYDKANKRWLTSRKMVILILERDPRLSDVLAYNELSNNVQSRTAWPWPHAKVGDVTNAVDLLLGKYLTDEYGLPSISRAALAEAIQTVAHTRRFHPIREYLQGLQWDGVSRIDKWLIHVLGERPKSIDDKPATINSSMTEYLQVVGRCWLLGMVNRVMNPGCKFDYCPVLEGAGGLRKSTMVETLAGSKFYSDTPFEVGRGKEAQEQVQGLWLYEIAEMTHFSKAEVGAIKAFISSKVDRYREAYGATLSTFERQCVLVGTTNENTYLRDRTGNRRFWPIPVRNSINIAWLEKWRDQLLAEAYALYLQATPFTPTPDQELRLFKPMQESRLVETAVLSELLHVLTRPPTDTGIQSKVNELTDFVTIAQLSLALGVDAAKSSPALEAQIRGWLDHEGWERCKKQINGARAWGYARPRDWPKAEVENDMQRDPDPAADNQSDQDADDAPF